MLLLLFGSTIVVFRLVVTRRLTTMARHFKDIAAHPDGPRMTPLTVRGNDEIAVLGSAFNTLVGQLRAVHDSLEQRVQERTADLAQANEELKREVSDRLQAEGALRASEEKYRAVVETTNTGFVILDSEGTVLDANAEYLRLTGRKTLHDILGRKVSEWTAEHDLIRSGREAAKCLEQGFIRDMAIEYTDEQGRLTPVELNATVLRTGDGIRILSLCRDITDRRRTQKVIELAIRPIESDRKSNRHGRRHHDARRAGARPRRTGPRRLWRRCLRDSHAGRRGTRPAGQCGNTAREHSPPDGRPVRHFTGNHHQPSCHLHRRYPHEPDYQHRWRISSRIPITLPRTPGRLFS